MSKQLKRLLAASLEDAMVEPIVEEAPNELVLEEDVYQTDIPEADVVDQLETTNSAIDLFSEAVDADTAPTAAALEAYAVAFESILCAGGCEGIFSSKTASLESVATLRVSMEEVRKRTEIALEGLVDKILNRIDEIFGKYKFDSASIEAKCNAIGSGLKSAHGAASHSEIKVTDGNRLFVANDHSFGGLVKGFQNIKLVSDAINQNIGTSFVDYVKTTAEKIKKNYGTLNVALDLYFYGPFVLLDFVSASNVKNQQTADTDIKNEKAMTELKQQLAPIMDYKGNGIHLPGGCVVQFERPQPGYLKRSFIGGQKTGIPMLSAPSEYSKSTVEIKTPSISELKQFIRVLKEAAVSCEKAHKVLQSAWTSTREAIRSIDGGISEKRRARFALEQVTKRFFKAFLEINEYSGLTLSHGVAFAEKAAKLYH